MTWFVAFAKGHHGFPQPESGYAERTYERVCPHCGIHGDQIAPFRMRRPIGAASSDFLQLNWVFDTFFASPPAAAAISDGGLRGATFGPVLEHKSGDELGERLQLCIDTVVACVNTSELPVVTCAPNNEEGEWGLPGSKPPSGPYCGRVKHHAPTTVAIDTSSIPPGLDLLRSDEWFGSGRNAFRLTLCSKRFVDICTQRGLRGIAFEAAITNGVSKRVV